MSRIPSSTLAVAALVPGVTEAIGKVNGEEVFTVLPVIESKDKNGKVMVPYGVVPLLLSERTRKLPKAIADKSSGRTLKFADGSDVPKGHGLVRSWITQGTSKEDVTTDLDDDGNEVVESIESTRARVTMTAPTEQGKSLPIPLALPVVIGDAVVVVDLLRDVTITRVSAKGKVSTITGKNGQVPVTVNGGKYVADVTVIPVLKGKRWGMTVAIGR